MTMQIDYIPGSCPICRSVGGRRLWHFRPADMDRDFGLERCLVCGSVYVNPRAGREDMLRFFSDEGMFQSSTDPEGRSRSLVLERDRRRREFARYVRRIRRLVPRGRVLDVGCGLGLFLEMLGPGYERLGIDVNAFAVRFTRDMVGCRVMEADAMALDFSPNTFHLVSLMQTLDHLDSPGRFMKIATSWLKPGGVLFLSALINIRSPMAKIFREKFRLLHPFHVVYFSPAIVRKYLTELGFRVLRLEYPYITTPYFRVADLPETGLNIVRRLTGCQDQAGHSPPFIGNTINVYAIKEA